MLSIHSPDYVFMVLVSTFISKIHNHLLSVISDGIGNLNLPWLCITWKMAKKATNPNQACRENNTA